MRNVLYMSSAKIIIKIGEISPGAARRSINIMQIKSSNNARKRITHLFGAGEARQNKNRGDSSALFFTDRHRIMSMAAAENSATIVRGWLRASTLCASAYRRPLAIAAKESTNLL